MTDLTLLLHSLKKAKSIIDAIEAKLLDSSLLSLFKTKNYQSHSDDLTVVCNIVIPIHVKLETYDSDSIAVKTFLKSSISYAYALNMASISLATLSLSLKIKANNGKYSMNEYQSDLADYREVKLLLEDAEKKMLGDYQLFDLNIMAIDCYVRAVDTSKVPMKSQNSATTKSVFPRKMTHDEVEIEKRYKEQVLENAVDTHCYNITLKEGIDLELKQVGRLSEITDEDFKLEVARVAMSLLYGFSQHQYKFSKFNSLKLNEKTRLLYKAIDNLEIKRDLSHESLNASNRKELLHHYIFNLVALFFQAHMIANDDIKNCAVSAVIMYFRSVSNSDINYLDYY